MSISKFSLFWDVQNEGRYTGTPVLQRTRNDLDAHGMFLGLSRLPAEDNVSYYKRLQSVLPLRGGSDSAGLVHGITRDLGLEAYTGIKISPVTSGGSWKAPAPHVEITSTHLILYSEYYSSTSNTIDSSIEIFGHGDAYLLSNLVTQIQLSDYFVAELGSSATGNEKSGGLMRGSSSVTVINEWIPGNTYFALGHSDIIRDTLNFSEKSVFSREVTPLTATNRPSGMTLAWSVSSPVVADGDYYVDYERGLVTCFTSASSRGNCRYTYRDFPWYVRWSPIAVYSLRDTTYRNKVFELESMPDNSTQQGLVTAEGSEVYTQIFNKSRSLWGE